jgi:hypothetical protein
VSCSTSYAPSPPIHALALTQRQAAEIFQSGVIPADTDYRIFRDFGEIPGIDMAFYQNGYVCVDEETSHDN